MRLLRLFGLKDRTGADGLGPLGEKQGSLRPGMSKGKKASGKGGNPGATTAGGGGLNVRVGLDKSIKPTAEAWTPFPPRISLKGS